MASSFSSFARAPPNTRASPPEMSSIVSDQATTDPAGAQSWGFDADGHVVEPDEVWTTYLPVRFRSYAPRVLQEADHFRFVCNDRLGFRIAGRHESLAAPSQTPH